MANEGTRRGYSHFFLNALRIATGVLFWQHGARKLFGWLGAEGTAELFSQMWLAGMLEFWGGILIVLGLVTRPVALVLAVEMVIAYFQAHFPRAFWPINNGGELAALYTFIFLFFAANGGGAFSLDGLWSSRRRDKVAD